MALVNYSLPFGAINAPPAWATISPSIHASPHAVNNLYEPAHRQENVVRNDDYYQNKNGPYRHHHPQQQQQQTQNSRNYLPPPQPAAQQTSNNRNGYAQSTASRTRPYADNSYAQQQPPVSYSTLSQNTGFYSNTRQQQVQQPQQQSFKENPFQQKQQIQTTKVPPSRSTVSYQPSSITNNNINNRNNNNNNNPNVNSNTNINTNNNKNFNFNQAGYPQQPPGFKPIQSGQGSKTQNGKLYFYFSCKRWISFCTKS